VKHNMTTDRPRQILLVLVIAALAIVAPTAGDQRAISSHTAARIDAESVRAAHDLDQMLSENATAIYQALNTRFQPQRAMDVVTFMDQFWRVAGNPGFNASLDHIKAGLLEAGYREGRTHDATSSALWFEEYPNGGNGWELVRADMTIVSAATGTVPEPVFDPVIDYIALCMNSFSTPADGVTAPLVYVGTGTDATSYTSVDVKGAVVLGDGGMRGLFEQAVRQRGAIGVITAAAPSQYTRPDETPEVFEWGSVPYDAKAQAFGFKASRKVADRLKARLRAGAVTVKTIIETSSRPASPGRMLIAEIPGRMRPNERVVMVAHIQEPGANDDASGCGTLMEMARALQAAIAAKALPPPARTLTFVWGDEMRASREWLKGDPARPTETRYMISLDMTGEDTTKTGGTFLIEKEPDPSAVWPRPSDPHTEWWPGNAYKAEALRGSLMNDLYLAVCLKRSRETGWVVQTNPYEGGSDHSMFLAAGVPALLATHFTDRYYHTNLDRADKTSPAVMGHVGIATGTTAMLLASAGETDALAVADLVVAAATRRLALESRQSAAIMAQATDRTAAEATERAVMDAWKLWYARALDSVLTLPVTPASDTLQARVTAAKAKIGVGPQ
jgi:aminopeptidase YwaD